jgi:hypothetical protein
LDPEPLPHALLFEYEDALIVRKRCKLGRLDKESSRPCRWSWSLRQRTRGALAGFILRGLTAAFAVPAVLVGAELAAIVPRPLARGLEQAHAITNYELPYIATSLQARLLWHEHAQDEPSHESLYEVLRARHRGTQARVS